MSTQRWAKSTQYRGAADQKLDGGSDINGLRRCSATFCARTVNRSCAAVTRARSTSATFDESSWLRVRCALTVMLRLLSKSNRANESYDRVSRETKEVSVNAPPCATRARRERPPCDERS